MIFWLLIYSLPNKRSENNFIIHSTSIQARPSPLPLLIPRCFTRPPLYSRLNYFHLTKDSSPNSSFFVFQTSEKKPPHTSGNNFRYYRRMRRTKSDPDTEDTGFFLNRSHGLNSNYIFLLHQHCPYYAFFIPANKNNNVFIS